MKGKILGILKEKPGISGELLSKKLGISRVAVWKHIQSLRAKGYVIKSSHSGYELLSSPDILIPEELTDIGMKIIHYDTINSTMDIAKSIAQKGKTGIVIAETQTKGRGRLKREWCSQNGGIYFTAILKPNISPMKIQLLNLAAGVAVAKAIRKTFGLNANLKWPNDVLINGKKVCGILSEIDAESDIVNFMNLGVGINVNNDIPIENGAVSIKKLLGKSVSRKGIFKRVTENIRESELSMNIENMLSQWRDLSSTLDSYVRVVTHRKIIEGKAIDIDSNGALLVRTGNGIERVIAGDCIHVRR